VLGVAIVGASALLSGHPVLAADDKNKQKVSKELAPALKAAQDALQAKKFPEALAKLKEAEGNPKKTPYDQHIINELAGVAYAKTSNYPEAPRRSRPRSTTASSMRRKCPAASRPWHR